jgi:SsrA-binding protein
LASPQKNGIKILSDNRQAGYNYFLMERWEAGVVLTGTEVKAARAGKIQLRDAYAEITGNEAWLVNAHISEYSHGNQFNHNPVRKRKLLLHRQEIDKLIGKTQNKGLTLIATKLYLKEGLVKCEIALAQGKKQYDKRDVERKKVQDAEAREGFERNRK